MRQFFDLSINDYNRELFTEFKTVVEQREGESAVHMIMKVLAVGLVYQDGILIEPNGIDHQFKPDVLIRAVDGRPSFWVECGQVKTGKLDKLTNRYRDTDFLVVKRLEREIRDLKTRAEKDVRHPWRLEYLGFDPGFVESLAARVTGRNAMTLIRSDDQLTAILNDFSYESALYRDDHGKPGYSGKNYV